jgi:hypothetical protein
MPFGDSGTNPKHKTKRPNSVGVILIVIAAVGLLLGIGRCGFLQPILKPADDYGISGSLLLFVGLVLLIIGYIWLTDQ